MSAAQLYVDLLERGFRLRIDDEDRLRVSPGDRLTAADRVAVRRHRDELLAMVGIDAEPGETAVETPAPSVISRTTPSGCIAPRVCLVLGICGRSACIQEGERAAFEAAVLHARAEGNPHRVSDADDDAGMAA